MVPDALNSVAAPVKTIETGLAILAVGTSATAVNVPEFVSTLPSA